MKKRASRRPRKKRARGWTRDGRRGKNPGQGPSTFSTTSCSATSPSAAIKLDAESERRHFENRSLLRSAGANPAPPGRAGRSTPAIWSRTRCGNSSRGSMNSSRNSPVRWKWQVVLPAHQPALRARSDDPDQQTQRPALVPELSGSAGAAVDATPGGRGLKPPSSRSSSSPLRVHVVRHPGYSTRLRSSDHGL